MESTTAQWVEAMSASSLEFSKAVREMNAWFRDVANPRDALVRATRAKWFAQQAAKKVEAVFPGSVNQRAFDAVFESAKAADRQAMVKAFVRSFTAPASVSFE